MLFLNLWNWIFGVAPVNAGPIGMQDSLLQYELKFIDEKWDWKQLQSEYKVFLVVNTATGCGLHKQLGQLEELYLKYQSQGLLVIAVPSSDFLSQEPLDGAELIQYCSLEYGATYPMTYKMHVASEPIAPLFQWLSKIQKPKWNYQKYLFNAQGHCVFVAGPTQEPLALESQIQSLLSV